MNQVFSAEQAVMAARHFLLEPGRLSGWHISNSSDIILKKLSSGENLEASGIEVSEMLPLPAVDPIDILQITTWYITFSVRPFSGKTTLEVFLSPFQQKVIIRIISDSVSAGMLRALSKVKI